MGRILLFTGVEQQMRTNTPPNEVENWEYEFPDEILVPSELYNLPFMQIDIDVVFDCIQIPGVPTKGTRFLNPPQEQIGYYQEIYNGFVTNNDRILYGRQAARLRSCHLSLPGSYPNSQLPLERTPQDSFGYSYNPQNLKFCILREPDDGSGGMGFEYVSVKPLSIVTRNVPGSLRLAARQPLLAGKQDVFINKGVEYPSKISGVIWSGWAGSLRTEISYYTAFIVPGYETDFASDPLPTLVNNAFNCGNATPGPPQV